MFIQIGGISGAFYNVKHIKSYRNLWRRKDKDFEKNGCEVTFADGEMHTFEDHIDRDINDRFTIIPAQDGWVTVEAYHIEDEGFEYSLNPIIAWKIDKYGSTPITSTTSYEDFAGMRSPWGWKRADDVKVYHFDSVYDNLDAFLLDAKKKLS